MKKDLDWFMEQMKSMTRMRDTDSDKESWYISEGALLDALDQLDEPEVLSQDWIRDNLERKGIHFYVNTFKLQNLLVPKQELPVIPKFVADWYEEHKDNLENQLRGIAFNLDKYGEMPEVNVLDKWVNETESPLQTLASLKFGYEVEEEQKYYVLNNEKYFLLGKDKVHGFIFSTGGNSKLGSMERTSATFELTEQEIKGYDPRYMTFATKVEELEE